MINCASQEKSKTYRWLVVLMLWSICFLNYADRQVIFSVFPLLSQEFGFSKLQLGLIGSSFMWIYAVGSFAAGFLCDRWSRKSLIFGGCFFWSLVTMLTGWCFKLWHFVAVRTMEGLGEVFYFPASNAMIADYHNTRTRSTALSLHQSGVYFGTIIGSWLGAWIAERYGWRYGFYLFGGIGVFVSLILYRFLKEPARGLAEKKSENNQTSTNFIGEENLAFSKPTIAMFLAYIAKQPIIMLLMFAYMSANFVTGIFFSWMPTFLYEKFSMTLSHAGGSAVMTVQVASIVGVLITGKLVDRLSLTMADARVFMQIVSLFLGCSAIVAVGTASSVTFVLLAMTCFGFCKGGYDGGIFASQFDYVEPRFRGSIVGLMNTFGGCGGALGTFVIGAVSSYGAGTAMARMGKAISWSASIYFLGALLLSAAFFLSRRRKSVLLEQSASSSLLV